MNKFPYRGFAATNFQYGSPVIIQFYLKQIAREGFISVLASVDVPKTNIRNRIKTDHGKPHFWGIF